MVRIGSRRIYVVDKKILKTNLTLIGDDFCCSYCGDRFVEGDTVHTNYNKNIKWYHKKCYELTLYDGR